MKNKWQENINTFIELATKHQVKMIMVGGGAVNFYGYLRHSANIEFWIDTTTDNLNKLIAVFKEMNYEIEDFPEAVKRQEQNISIKFSPVDLNLELITRFSINKAFEEAYADSEKVEINGEKLLRWNVLSFNDLITSKIIAGRPKDLLDIQQLKQLNK